MMHYSCLSFSITETVYDPSLAVMLRVQWKAHLLSNLSTILESFETDGSRMLVFGGCYTRLGAVAPWSCCDACACVCVSQYPSFVRSQKALGQFKLSMR